MAARDLSLREKRLIQVAILLVIIVLALLLLRGGGGGAPPPGPMTAPVTGPSVALPPVAPPAPVATVAPVPPVLPAADLSQLRLYGLLASGAVVGYANGGQRLVPVGREALPGLTLVRIEQNHAIFQSAGGEVRLGFDGIAAPAPAAAMPPAAVAPGGAFREETLRYRLGLAPRIANGRAAGYVVRANVEMPALARAGIRPGDVIVAVDGSVFDEQKLEELARIIANNAQTRFEVERFGRRLQLSFRPR
jgi:type II secretory pathway component PulC